MWSAPCTADQREKNTPPQTDELLGEESCLECGLIGVKLSPSKFHQEVDGKYWGVLFVQE